MTALQFDLSGLREKATVSFERRLEPAGVQTLLEGAGVFISPLIVQLSAARHGAGIKFEGTVAGEWEFVCARCLGPARLDFRTRVEGEVSGIPETLDAAEEVRQALNLALPLNAHCRPDCKGLCPQCGGDRNKTECGCRPPESGERRNDA